MRKRLLAEVGEEDVLGRDVAGAFRRQDADAAHGIVTFAGSGLGRRLGQQCREGSEVNCCVVAAGPTVDADCGPQGSPQAEERIKTRSPVDF